MSIYLIAAMSENFVIGKNNSLPWNIPEDLKFFKEKTLNKAIIMGRKTFNSLPGILPQRTHIVISRTLKPTAKIHLAQNLDFAINIAKKLHPQTPIMIIGGGEVFQEAIKVASFIYLTRIHQHITGDVFFPHFSSQEWELKTVKKHHQQNQLLDFSFELWERKATSKLEKDFLNSRKGKGFESTIKNK